MTRALDIILCTTVALCLIGLVGTMDAHDQQQLAEHEAQTAKAVAVELDRSVAWEALYTESQKLTGFPKVVAK